MKREDGRRFDEMREIEVKAGIIKKADGSAYFRIGKTAAYAAVYGPRELHPRFLQDPKQGVLRCHYNMMPFSGMGERVRPGPSRRSVEISYVSEKALLPVVKLDDFPYSVVDVFIELPETDAGSRCAGICAASIALADAGLQMRDMVAAIAVGKLKDDLLVDLSYNEEQMQETKGHKVEVADIPMAVVPSTGEITLLQMDGIISKEDLFSAIELGKKACGKIAEIQRQALKERFKKVD